MSLHNLALRLSKLARTAEALTAVEEAVEIDRALAQARPETHRAVLAESISNLGERLADLGRIEEALNATDGAISMYRQLDETQSVLFRSELAESLRNRGNQLSALGRHQEALVAVEESVNICRPLAAANPALNRTNLARSLCALASVLAAISAELDRALDTAQQAVASYGLLAGLRPVAFHTELQDAIRLRDLLIERRSTTMDTDSHTARDDAR